MCQIASFYAGAMAEARSIELGPITESVDGVELVLISPNDPEAMLRHTRECRHLGLPFAADPSQQLARMDGAQTRELIDGARYLFSNDYEWSLLLQKSGWSEREVLSRLGMRITTLGEKGVEIIGQDIEPLQIAAVPETAKVEPTGLGDGFRAGFLAARSEGLGVERAAQLGSLIAVHVLETIGTQEWRLDPSEAVARIDGAYGPEAAAELAELLHR